MVSNLVSKIPSINLGLCEGDRSANFCKNTGKHLVKQNVYSFIYITPYDISLET
ncbi:hypothetical protein Hanom_Chr05g00404321 [Helianthus anomalus]